LSIEEENHTISQITTTILKIVNNKNLEPTKFSWNDNHTEMPEVLEIWNC